MCLGLTPFIRHCPIYNVQGEIHVCRSSLCRKANWQYLELYSGHNLYYMREDDCLVSHFLLKKQTKCLNILTLPLNPDVWIVNVGSTYIAAQYRRMFTFVVLSSVFTSQSKRPRLCKCIIHVHAFSVWSFRSFRILLTFLKSGAVPMSLKKNTIEL